MEMENSMRILTSLLTLSLLASPALAETKTFTDVSVVDVACSKKVAADADSHTRDCALMCQKSGYGIVTEDKKFIKFDADGNAKVLEALKASDKKDHLRVTVSGDVKGDTMKVSSVQLL
jgi:Tfp pilus assembly ATPase PilU